MDTAFVLILEGELWWANLDDNDLLMEVMVIDCQWRSHVWLHGVSGELNAWIVLIFVFYISKDDIILSVADTWIYYLVNQ